jgi:Lon protease-like protein
MHAARNGSDRIRIRDVGKSKAPARGVLRAQFFDDQWVGQGGQLCQTKNTRGFNSFLTSGFRWLASSVVASANWLPWIPLRIQRAKIVIP